MDNNNNNVRKRILSSRVFIESAVGVIYAMHPYHKPKDIDDIVEHIIMSMREVAVYKSNNYCQVELDENNVYDFVDKCLKGCQAFRNLNLSQAEIDKGISVDDEKREKWVIGGASDGSHLKEYYDFIDLDACIRNIVNKIFDDFLNDDIFLGRVEIIEVKK